MTFTPALAEAQGSRWAFYQHVFHATATYGALSALVSAIARQRFSCSLGVMLCGVSLLGSRVISQFLKETQQALKAQDSIAPPPASTPTTPVAASTEDKVAQLASSIQTAASSEVDAQDLPVVAPPETEDLRRSSTDVSPVLTPPSESHDHDPLLTDSTLLLGRSAIREADEARLADENNHGVLPLDSILIK